MTLKSDLMMYHNFEQDPLLTPPFWDQSHNNYHLTPANNPSWVAGKLGKGMQCDGGAQSASVKAGVDFQGKPWTFSMWYKPLSFSEGASILTTSVVGSVSLGFDGSNYYFTVTIGGKTLAVPAVPLVAGRWYHLSFGYRSEPVGQEIVWMGVNMDEGQHVIQTVNAAFGSSFVVGGTGVHGVYDELAVWRRAVDVNTELWAIYNNGKALPFEDWDKVTPCKTIKCCD